ncbi:hypothetical protein HPS57_13915 [Prevotella sp. PINT]|jgi:hypothetical protein|uniref:hypothetical protein n=1 Tax=Palleniella intestinalis TaxID=2736291 RepID=UPI001556F7D0|nr:hypothetical protein [Palleniella intestinalis]NPD83060.1 hypothetical protein [Palleniella intestinalis]
MKKILYTIIALAMSAFALQSCEDVPEPYDIPGQETGGGTDIPTVEPAGDGTEANPYNVTGALQYTKALPADVNSENEIYIKGKITSIVEINTSSFGNATFYLADEGDDKNTFYVFRCYDLGNKKFTSEYLQVGDEVVVKGLVVNFKGNTPETVTNKAYLYSVNGNTGGGDKPSTGEAKGDGTLENPYNSVAATELAAELADNATSEDVYIKGKVVSIKEQFGKEFGNATFYISDEGTATDQFYIYRALYLGNQKYTEGILLKEGDEVVVYGKVMKYVSEYGTTLETAQGKAYVYSINGKTTSDAGETPVEPEVKGFDFSKQGYTNAENVDGKAIKYDENTTMTFAKADGGTPPAYYNTGSAMRMYGSNTLTINSTKTIKNITITFATGTDTSNRPYYATADNSAFNPATVAFDNNISTWTVGGNTATLTYTTKGGHFRVKTISVEYAE